MVLSRPVYISFSTSTVMAMSRLEVSSVLSCGRGESIRGTGTRLVTPRTSSARTSTGVFGSIREVLGIGVDTALIGPALSGSIFCLLDGPSFSISPLGLLGVPSFGLSLGFFGFLLSLPSDWCLAFFFFGCAVGLGLGFLI